MRASHQNEPASSHVAEEGKEDEEGDIGGLSSVERYDPADNAWSLVAALSTTRFALALAVLDGKLYAMGGSNALGPSALNSVEVYDPAANAWSAVAPMKTARLGHGAAVADGKIWVVGGGRQSSAECYDPASNTWTEVAPMSQERIRMGCCAL